MISPILMKPLLEPIARESTIRDEIYPCVAVTNCAAREDVVMLALLRDTVDPLKFPPGTAPLMDDTLKVSVDRVWNCATVAVSEEVIICCVDVCAKSDIPSYHMNLKLMKLKELH